MALVGTETLQVLGLDGAGHPAAATQQTTPQEITNVPTSKRGTLVANGTTTVVVADTNVLATSAIAITLNTLGGAQGAQPTVVAIVPGVSFSIKATAADTSTYNYAIL